jgi:hypothetical protein
MKRFRLPALGLLLFSLAGCDTPQRSRAPISYVVDPGMNSFGAGNSSFTGTTGGSWTGATTGTTTGGTPTTEPGFELCDLSDRFSTVDIGLFGICQSTIDETAFKFRTATANTSVRTCLIPTFKDSLGSSTYIGNPQCAFTAANQVLNGRLYKDRPGFSGYALNGVIVMKEPLLPEYIACMQGYTNWPVNVCPTGPANPYCATWIPRCPFGARSSAFCDAEAKAYMRNLCERFKSKYANGYVDIRTR